MRIHSAGGFYAVSPVFTGKKKKKTEVQVQVNGTTMTVTVTNGKATGASGDGTNAERMKARRIVAKQLKRQKKSS